MKDSYSLFELDEMVNDMLREALPRPLGALAVGALRVVTVVDRLTGGAVLRLLARKAGV